MPPGVKGLSHLFYLSCSRSLCLIIQGILSSISSSIVVVVVVVVVAVTTIIITVIIINNNLYFFFSKRKAGRVNPRRYKPRKGYMKAKGGESIGPS